MGFMFGNAVAIDGGEIGLSHQIDGGEIGVFYDSGGGSFPPYIGPYVVDPMYRDVELETRNRVMTGNVVVKEIYVSRVTNPAGGKTVTIGG